MPAPRNYTHLLLLVLFLGTGCFEGAPRRHPLDPQGENFQDIGGLSVLVNSFYAPRQGLTEATVRLTPGSFIGETDAQGRVFIPDLESGNYIVTVEKPGFAKRAIETAVSAGETINLEVLLPGLPVFEQISINTVHISRWWPPPEELFRLQIQTSVNDPDGLADIETVWLELPDFGFSVSLRNQFEPGTFQHILQETELPVSLASLLGHKMILRARDRTSSETESETLGIFRIIESSPIAVEPQGLVLLSTDTPRLQWQSENINYPFSYKVDVVRVDNNIQNLAWTLSNIPSDSSSVLTAALPRGEYFWTVSIVDEFGNLSRSREAGFRIP